MCLKFFNMSPPPPRCAASKNTGVERLLFTVLLERSGQSTSVYCASNARRVRLRRGAQSSARTWSSIARQCFTAASATLFVMTAQGAQTNTVVLTGWKDCRQRQQGREGRGTEEDISVWRYDVACAKLHYFLSILSIFSYAAHLEKLIKSI